MASNASVARPYAQAVFELAGESGAYEAWSDTLALLSAVTSDPDFAALLHDPRVTHQQVSGLLTDLSAEKLPEGGKNFIRLLVRNDRVEALPDISRLYELCVAAARKSINAEVVTALALSEDQKARLSTALEQHLGCSVSLEETIDEKLLGGAILKAGPGLGGGRIGRV